MIKNIVFDFGDIFINLDKKKFANELQKLGVFQNSEEMRPVLQQYEKGLISTDGFLTFFEEKLNIPSEKLVATWNSILLDFPKKRLEFIQELAKSKKYRLFLLSNTNDLHISWIKKDWGMDLYHSFKICFEQFYLSHEINFRKPDNNIYEFVLRENNLIAEETLFIDDTKENTDGAKALGIEVWHLLPGTDDVVELFTKNQL
ncbi:HAD family hydrolase [Polaribacter sp. IC073]|uniref:HAD family hydrolase n=1 Tax=Polaribacter sp. IC073 TaxID=2508540 RepID=UPI0011BEA14E|nr:HAD family phosphatase [Polaribacter sp. IC073]TXD46500.1 HAD family phosphatase [Polaribacter sp. IC073]